MKKIIVLISIFIALSNLSIAQSSLKTTDGNIHFNASTPLEDIDAINKQVNAILKTENGNFASVLLIKDFKFRRKLMQEHFNENYMDSKTYPKAYFSGKIEGFTTEGLSTSPKKYQVSGKLTIHGVTKDIKTEVQLSKTAQAIRLVSNFIIKPEDYNIKIPRIVFTKIAQEVMVDVDFSFEK